jgi:pimeloyl-ACP methyl ester carboxylesterase
VTPRRFDDVFYLHGFASSGQSKKAAYFAERLRSHGIALRAPDFNEPDFLSLTMTRMLDHLAADIARLDPPSLAPQTHAGSGEVPSERGSSSPRAQTDRQPVVLIGSSLGAIVAIHTAARMPDRIDRLVLLAPALMFPRDVGRIFGADRVARWQGTGTLDLFHHGYGGMRALNYGFYQDSMQYDAFVADVRQPTLIFQGLHDEAVDHRVVAQYAAARPNVRLTLLDDDHRLMASLPRIWNEMVAFLELT